MTFKKSCRRSGLTHTFTFRAMLELLLILLQEVVLGVGPEKAIVLIVVRTVAKLMQRINRVEDIELILDLTNYSEL